MPRGAARCVKAMPGNPAGHPDQAALLSAVVARPCFKADELPPVPDYARRPPARSKGRGPFAGAEDEGE